jgi:hypothetical protein
LLNSHALALALALAGRSVLVAAQEPRVLDSFEQISAWSARPSEGVTVRLSADSGVRGRAMRVDFDFHGGSGYALIHRSLNVDLPANYAFSFYLRATSPPNNLEFKLIDSTGDNSGGATSGTSSFRVRGRSSRGANGRSTLRGARQAAVRSAASRRSRSRLPRGVVGRALSGLMSSR